MEKLLEEFEKEGQRSQNFGDTETILHSDNEILDLSQALNSQMEQEICEDLTEKAFSMKNPVEEAASSVCTQMVVECLDDLLSSNKSDSILSRR